MFVAFLRTEKNLQKALSFFFPRPGFSAICLLARRVSRDGLDELSCYNFFGVLCENLPRVRPRVELLREKAARHVATFSSPAFRSFRKWEA